MVGGVAGALAPDMSAIVGVGRGRQHTTRSESRASLVHDGYHED